MSKRMNLTDTLALFMESQAVTNAATATAITALSKDVAEIKASLTVGITPATPAAVKAPSAKPTTTKVYRSAKGKEAAKVEVAAVWENAKSKAGVKRVKDLSPKQRAAVDAQVKAIWAAVPKTRSTKA